MILAPTLTPHTPSGGYDADATAFAAASGATDVAALSAFVKGVKELGLWENMVCWPLRSSQNAGTGTTAYSLGGLGTYDGTLVNDPTWGADGIDFTDESSEHIITTLTPNVTDDFYMFAAYEGNAQGANNNAIAATRTAGIAKGFTFAANWSGAYRGILWTDTGVLEAIGSGASTDGSFNTATMRGDVSGATLEVGIAVNEGAEAAASVAGTVSAAGPLLLGNESTIGPRSLGGILSFAAYIKAPSINSLALRTLYKSTLGTGLGLP